MSVSLDIGTGLGHGQAVPQPADQTGPASSSSRPTPTMSPQGLWCDMLTPGGPVKDGLQSCLSPPGHVGPGPALSRHCHAPLFCPLHPPHPISLCHTVKCTTR